MTRKITVTYELPEEICTVLEDQARREDRSFEDVVAEYWLRHHPPRPKLTPEEFDRRKRNIESLFGSIDSGDENSSDNDCIDEDLAREYESRSQ
jgi:hypothetical protein